MVVRRAAVVHGHVQGVSFRWWTRQVADDLGVVGWVRNESDGTVRVEVQGEQLAVDSLLDRLHRGPPAARVRRVDVTDVDPDPAASEFAITRATP